MHKECPFCHKNKLKMETKSGKFHYKDGVKHHTLTASIRCNCCHSRGPTVSTNYTMSYLDIWSEIEKLAWDAWDNRG